MRENLSAVFNRDGFLHHAYLIVGESGAAAKELAELLPRGETYQEDCRVFGIDQSRLLKERQSRKVAAGERRIFILAIGSITLEAQQALLKTLEEPNPNNLFFLIAPSEYLFLPTLRSRFEIIRLPPPALISDEAGHFLSLAPEARLAFLADKLTAEENNKEPLFTFLNQLEVFLAPKVKLSRGEKIKILEAIKTARDFIRQRGSNPRLILEHLALVLPRLKTHAKI